MLGIPQNRRQNLFPSQLFFQIIENIVERDYKKNMLGKGDRIEIHKIHTKWLHNCEYEYIYSKVVLLEITRRKFQDLIACGMEM